MIFIELAKLQWIANMREDLLNKQSRIQRGFTDVARTPTGGKYTYTYLLELSEALTAAAQICDRLTGVEIILERTRDADQRET